jgi:putative transposase
MSTTMDTHEMKALAAQIAKNIKTEKDLTDFSRLLKKMTVEAALGAEMEAHLGYAKHDPQGHHSGNSRNGYSDKTLKGEHGEVTIEVPRDRNGTFEPQLVRKGQTRLTQLDEQIHALYAKGMSTRDIVATFKELYGAEVCATVISKVTEAVIEKVHEWQSRLLDEVYPILYLDCLQVKIRQDKRVINKAIYVALGVDLEGHKELLGLWLSENEGAKFWLSVLTELHSRGIKDIFIACVDGLKGFPEAINTVYPHTKVQLCIVHMVRNSLRFVSWKDKQQVALDLKKIYSSHTEDEAERELAQFEKIWDKKYVAISRSWRENWPNVITLFDYPDEIRKVIYTTNAIESLNSVIRKVIKNRKIFPHDDSALKAIWLAVQSASKKWTMPLHHWNVALNRFMMEYQGRLPRGY